MKAAATHSPVSMNYMLAKGAVELLTGSVALLKFNFGS